jgi:hypothetical protein
VGAVADEEDELAHIVLCELGSCVYGTGKI